MGQEVSRNRNICFLIPSLESGGMERVMSEIVNYVSENTSMNVYLILYGRKSTSPFYFINEKVNIIQNPTRAGNKLMYILSIIYFIRKNVLKINPVSVLSFGEKWNNFVLLSMLASKCKVIVSDRSNPDISLGVIHECLRKCLYRYANLFIAQTQTNLDKLMSKVKVKKSIVIPNPIQTFPVHNIIDDMRENIILHVGRFSKVKNQEFLIDTFIHMNRTDWELVLVGDDHAGEGLKEALSSKVNKAGWSNNIKICDATRDIYAYYSKARIFAFPSLYEGFPNVVAEALAVGLPVVASTSAVYPSGLIKNGENGYLINIDDGILDFEVKLLHLMNSRDDRIKMSECAIASVKHLECSAISQQYLDAMTAGCNN